ncbi:hypothetical protein LJX78_06505 [Methanimicrococcus blatticola]|uniref:hypothetical protein n=1 Tax=Methanimicrococcus blatticola TaxID=91560 RepID=UPI001E50899E|nr:hypothetical protein [Methanimicrococcus blatticola]MCC2509250.1 hypothetical protein [Methanimicrococcus blatticola]
MHLLILMTAVRLRERGHCYLPFALPLLPAVCVAAITYRLCFCSHLTVRVAAVSPRVTAVLNILLFIHSSYIHKSDPNFYQ